MSRRLREQKARERLERLLLEGTGTGEPVGLTPKPCAKCKGEGRVWVRATRTLPGQPVGDILPTPCPVCRPEASHLTPDGRVKDKAGLEAAAAARAKGL